MSKVEKRTDELVTFYIGNGTVEIHVKCENVADDIVDYAKAQLNAFSKAMQKKAEP